MVSALNHSFMMRSTLLENKFSWFAFGFSLRACYRTKFQPFWSQTYESTGLSEGLKTLGGGGARINVVTKAKTEMICPKNVDTSVAMNFT